MDESLDAGLDEILRAIDRLPEPLAVRLALVKESRVTGDATGVPRHLFAFGAGVVRYGVAVGLSLLAARSSGISVALAKRLTLAHRLTDGKWCELLREVAREPALKDAAELFSFGGSKTLNDFVASRNRFAHDHTTGGDVIALTSRLLDEARALLSPTLLFVRGGEAHVVENRSGLAPSSGVWQRVSSPNLQTMEVNQAYVEWQGQPRQVSPWLPLLADRIALPEAPLGAGGSWRSVDPRSTEHEEHTALSQAMRALSGDDPSVPRRPTDRPPLVGRESASEVLKRIAGEACSGRVRVVAITGRLGTGRSRLLQELRDAAPGLGFSLVLSGSCAADRRGPLRPLRAALASAGRDDALSRTVQNLVRTDVLSNPASLDDALEVVESTLLDASRHEPLLLAIDDLQWADELTLRLLRLLTECSGRATGARVLCAFSVRDEPGLSAGARRLLSEIDRDVGSAATRIALDPLDSRGASELVRGTAPIAEALERSLVNGAGGLPFLLVQPLLVWHEAGSLVWRDGHWWPADSSLLEQPPPGVAELLTARIESFFESGPVEVPDAEKILGVLSLVGARLDIAGLHSVLGSLGKTSEALDEVIDRLLSAGLLRASAPGRYELCQQMFADAMLGRMRARPWFQRAAAEALAAIEARPGADEEAAFLGREHRFLGDSAAARRWFRTAAERALGQGLFDSACENASAWRALASGDEEALEAELVELDALFKGGSISAAQERTRSLTPVESPQLTVRAALLTLLVEHAAGVGPDAAAERSRELLEKAESSGSTELRSDALMAAATVLRGPRGLAWLDEATRLFEAADARPERVHRACMLRVELLYEAGVKGEALVQAAERARDAARRLGSRWAELDSEADLAVMEFEAGRPEVALEKTHEVERRAREAGFPGIRRTALINRTFMALGAKRLEDSLSAAREAVSAAKDGASWRHLALAYSAESDALLANEKLEPSLAAIETAILLKQSHGDSRQSLTMLKKAELLELLGRPDESQQAVQQALSESERESSEPQRLHAKLWILVVNARGRAPEARRALAEFLETFDPKKLPAPAQRLLQEAYSLLGFDKAQ